MKAQNDFLEATENKDFTRLREIARKYSGSRPPTEPCKYIFYRILIMGEIYSLLEMEKDLTQSVKYYNDHHIIIIHFVIEIFVVNRKKNY